MIDAQFFFGNIALFYADRIFLFYSYSLKGFISDLYLKAVSFILSVGAVATTLVDDNVHRIVVSVRSFVCW